MISENCSQSCIKMISDKGMNMMGDMNKNNDDNHSHGH